MRKTGSWLLLIVLAAVVSSVFYYATRQTPSPSTPPLAEAPAAKPPEEPAIRYPVQQPSQEEVLPPLNESDAVVKEALAGLWGEKVLQQLFRLDGFIRRVVATVDNLPRQNVAQRLMPVKPTPGQFRTAGTGEVVSLNPDNAARYAPYVQLATRIDSRRVVALYASFYPLFQQAYEDLGYPTGYFNDRLVEVIDHLLASPELPADIKLVQPKVFYHFADPDLESRSAGQKILMRIGKDNATQVKAKLREIRGELTRGAPRRQ